MFKRFFILNGLGIVVGIIIFSILVGTHTIGSDATATKLTVNFAIFLVLLVIVNNLRSTGYFLVVTTPFCSLFPSVVLSSLRLS